MPGCRLVKEAPVERGVVRHHGLAADGPAQFGKDRGEIPGTGDRPSGDAMHGLCPITDRHGRAHQRVDERHPAVIGHPDLDHDVG